MITINQIACRFGAPKVESAEPDPIRHTSLTTPNDPYFSGQWALPATGMPPAWDIQRGKAEIVVAVIDTGVDYNHPDIAANIWTNSGEIAGDGIDNDGNGYVDDIRGWNFVDNNNDPMDSYGHGTHVAGIIGASPGSTGSRK
jgi:subtilisin family serine protease